jgi:hypothetical protein
VSHKVMDRPVSDTLFEAVNNMGMENNQLHKRVSELEEFQGGSVRLDAQDLKRATSPEIERLERQVAERKREIALTAKAQPGELILNARRDETGRQIREFYGDPAACWDAFKAPVRYVMGWDVKK